jgi:hypothetical protein
LKNWIIYFNIRIILDDWNGVWWGWKVNTGGDLQAASAAGSKCCHHQLIVFEVIRLVRRMSLN